MSDRVPTDEHFDEGEERAPPGTRVMAIVRWSIVVAIAIAAAASIAGYFGVFAPHAAATGDQYYCPMHPSVVQDHPGECPICSMTLVKKERGSPSQHSSQSASQPAMKAMNAPKGLTEVVLTPERIQLTGMKTAVVARKKLISEIRAVGVVSEDEGRRFEIHPRFSGWIESLRVAKTGQKVQKGEVLATIYSPDLLAAENEYLNAIRWKQSAPASPEDRATSSLAVEAKKRLELLGIAAEEIKAIEDKGEPMRALAIRSPVTGYVTNKNAIEGGYVDPGAELFRVADLSVIWVLADLYELELRRVHGGQKASLRLEAYPDESFEGRVDFIYPLVDPESRTIRIRLIFKNPKLELLPGMFGNVDIALPSAEGLVIPRDALIDTGKEQYVFLALEGGRFEPRRVRAGEKTDGSAQVLEGLSEGDVVVTTANFLIDSESRLRSAIEGQSAGGMAPMTGRGGGVEGPSCENDFARDHEPDKYRACKACETQHRGMGTMEADCKNAIPKPWR